MSEAVVRWAGTRDFQAVVDLEQRCFSDPWSPAALLSELVPDAMRLPLVVTVGGVVRGYVMAWRVADQLHILNIATDPEARREGLGTRLLREAARQGKEDGLLEITLEVRRSNTGARGFYEKHGFVESGVRRKYYSDNGEDAVIMTCPLSAVLGEE